MEIVRHYPLGPPGSNGPPPPSGMGPPPFTSNGPGGPPPNFPPFSPNAGPNGPPPGQFPPGPGQPFPPGNPVGPSAPGESGGIHPDRYVQEETSGPKLVLTAGVLGYLLDCVTSIEIIFEAQARDCVRGTNRSFSSILFGFCSFALTSV